MFILPGLLNVKMAECLWFYTSYSFLYFPESGFYGSHLSKWQTSTRCSASLLFSRILSEAEIDTHLVSLAERDWNWTGSMPLRALFKNIDCRLRAVCPLFAVHLPCSNKAEVFGKYVFSFFFWNETLNTLFRHYAKYIAILNSDSTSSYLFEIGCWRTWKYGSCHK